MSPSARTHIHVMGYDGGLTMADRAKGLRPVITLKHDAIAASVGGDGTAADPYIVR